ncbi:hypothetical protein BH23PLA1_BH23PLA1_36260 [soil metagenome]
MTATDPATTLDGSATATGSVTTRPAIDIDWAAALAEHGRWLRTVLRARLGEDQTVEEVLQDVSLAAVAQRQGPSDPGKVAPWLYRLAVRQALLYRRKRGRQRRLLDRYAQIKTECQDPHKPDPLGWLLAAERCQLVRQAMESLSERDREILLLKYTEDWSYRDLARHLGISESAVEARLHRVRQRLRDRLTGLDVT